jgi:hypothetical protein
MFATPRGRQPRTAHAFVVNGDGPCVILMVGARGPEWPWRGVVDPRSELALRHGAGVETEVTSPPEAWAQLGAGPRRLERPHDWNALPWA